MTAIRRLFRRNSPFKLAANYGHCPVLPRPRVRAGRPASSRTKASTFRSSGRPGTACCGKAATAPLTMRSWLQPSTFRSRTQARRLFELTGGRLVPSSKPPVPTECSLCPLDVLPLTGESVSARRSLALKRSSNHRGASPRPAMTRWREPPLPGQSSVPMKSSCGMVRRSP